VSSDLLRIYRGHIN